LHFFVATALVGLHLHIWRIQR